MQVSLTWTCSLSGFLCSLCHVPPALGGDAVVMVGVMATLVALVMSTVVGMTDIVIIMVVIMTLVILMVLHVLSAFSVLPLF